jgi:capsular polysaccharide biosynthesis protein
MIATKTGLSTIVAALWRQRVVFFATLAVGLVLAIAVALASKPSFVATATILMVAEPPESQNVKVPTTATKPLLSADLPSLATSATVLTSIRDQLHLTDTFDKLRSRIHAKVSVDSNVMPVTFSAPNEGAAVTGVNAVADTITAFYREIATTRFDSLIKDLRGQQAVRATELSQYDVALQRAARDYPYIDVHEGDGSSMETSVYQRLVALRTERDETDALAVADAASASQMHRRVSQVRPLAISEVVDNDVAYKNLRDQYGSDLVHLQHLSTFAYGAYPGLGEMRTIVAKERNGVAHARLRAAAAGPSANVDYVSALSDATKADAQFAGDRAKMMRLDTEIGSLEAQLRGDGVAVRVAHVRRDRDNAQTAYSILSATLAQTIADRAQAAATGSVVVIDHARFAQRSLFTTGTFALVVLAAVTIWAAISLALLADRLRRRFHDDETVGAVYGTPVIGSLG